MEKEVGGWVKRVSVLTVLSHTSNVFSDTSVPVEYLSLLKRLQNHPHDVMQLPHSHTAEMATDLDDSSIYCQLIT